ncbi:MAG: DNA mismatch repair endonuclease MutL [Christensenellales bacterium]|jgi:DNA mismatch repair protein MutL
MAIKVLDPIIVGRIAAGEVVDRPASAAKELIENAIDAGATAVTVEIRDGGIAYLRVTDNGSGIAPSQAALAFENHATSKIATAEQLDDIRTLGFRGEALPSIAAVSRIEMTTREKGAPSGVKLLIDGGVRRPIQEAGCPEGTTVVVSDLFYNLPVRRTFLKKPAYEASLISDLVARMILGNPGVSFRFISNKKTVYHSFGDGMLKHAVFTVYGAETAEKMTPLDTALGGMRISGMIGVGELSKPTRAHQSFYINGRSVHCALMTQALEQVCAGRVTIGTYPMCALMLTIPPASVDVNVHPNKLEVRFRDEQSIRQSAEGILAQAFAGETVLDLNQATRPFEHRYQVTSKQTVVEDQPTEVELERTIVESNQTEVGVDAPQEEPVRYRDVSKLELREDGFAITVAPPITREPEPTQISISDPPAPPSQPRVEPEFRIIGVLFKTYILIELEDALLMIDQHAAHERILYEKYKRRLENGEAASQALLLPFVMDVTPREMDLITSFDEALRDAGYEVEPFGDRSISVRAVPFVLGRANLRPAFMDTLDSLDRISAATREARRDEIAIMACKAAVKAGDTLTNSEISALIRQMRETGAPPTCPHGRPVFRTMTKRDIEKMFRRIQ